LDFLAHVIGTAFKLEALILATKACDGKLHFFVLLHGGIESHVVHLDGLVEFTLLKVDVAHVHSQPTGLRVLLILENNCVGVNCLLMQAVSMVHVSQIVEYVECEINIDLIQ
jgi:hypothetical protein